MLAAIVAFGTVSPLITAAAAPENPSVSATSSPTTTPSPTPSTTPGDGSTTISAPSFSPTNAVKLTGTKSAGSSITVTVTSGGVDSGSSPVLSIAANSSMTWSGTVVLQNGKGITLSATQSQDGSASRLATVVLDVLGAPTIDGSPGALTTGLVSGYAFAGATITASAFPEDTSQTGGGCTSISTSEGYWSCALNVQSGSYIVQAQQSRSDLGGGASSSKSGALEVVVDKNAPDRPNILLPVAGSTVGGTTTANGSTGRVLVSGVGESGGLADLYLDNSPICQTPVVNTAWNCSLTGVLAGSHTLTVIQRDAAGNYSNPSAPISVTFGAKGASVTTPTTPTKPAEPAVPGWQIPLPPSHPPQAAVPVTPTPPDSTAPLTLPYGALNNWSTPTEFGRALPTLSSNVISTHLALASLLALMFIVLVALPLRVLSVSVSGRFSRPSVRLTGRNRQRWERADVTQPTNPYLAGAVLLAAVAALIVFSGGITDEVRYLRLAAAVVTGLGILNVVGVAIATRAGARRCGVSGRLHFLPLLMLAAVCTALISRWTALEPPVVTGVLIGLTFGREISARSRAIVSLTEIGAITAIATLAWLGHGLLGSVDGFWGMFAEETLATLALAGFGSVVVLAIPIATLPGRAIFEWSRMVWVLTVAVVAVLGSMIVLGGATFPVLGALLLAAGFALMSVAVWAWFRFVEPAVGPDES